MISEGFPLGSGDIRLDEKWKRTPDVAYCTALLTKCIVRFAESSEADIPPVMLRVVTCIGANTQLFFELPLYRSSLIAAIGELPK